MIPVMFGQVKTFFGGSANCVTSENVRYDTL